MSDDREFTEFVMNLDPMFANSANYMFVFNAKSHGGASLEQAHAAGVAAHHAAVYGHDAKKDRAGNYIPQGIGSPGRENGNHLAAILKYFGPAAYQKELQRIWKETPDHAKRMGFPQAQRISA
jgi:hypothetical protein